MINMDIYHSVPTIFSLFILKQLLNIPIHQEQNEELNKWYEYLSADHSKNDDCDFFIQLNFSGCNIISRNILITSKNRVVSKRNKTKIN